MSTKSERSRLAFGESGSGDPVVFIHAFPLDRGMWEAQLKAAPPGWHAIAPDLPGFGESPPLEGVSSIDTYADAVAELIESMGGYVALSLHRRHPELVRALILSDTRAEADTQEARMGRLEMARRVRAEGMDPLIESMLHRLVARVTRLSRPEVMAALRKTMEQTIPETAATALAAMAHRADSTSMLRDISVPALVVVGIDDEITPPGEAQLLARSIRGARIEIIEGAGHLPNIERSDNFNAVLRSFLSTLPTAQPS